MAYISAVKSPDNTTYDIKSYKTAAIAYGTIDSGSTSTVLTATVDGITALYDGVCCYIENGVVTSASGATLNVNSLGAKPIYLSTASATAITTEFDENSTCLFVYNSTRVSGGCWDFFAPSSGESAVQSDWEETDTTDPAYILNKPPIKEGEGTNSIVECHIEQESGAAQATIYITGAASATTFTYTVKDGDTLPPAGSPRICYCATAKQDAFSKNTRRYQVGEFDTTNSTVTFPKYLSTTALTNAEVIVYSKQQNVIGEYSHVEGRYNFSAGDYSHIEGRNNLASGTYAHSEGSTTVASGMAAHAENIGTMAAGNYSHSEGYQCSANGGKSHAEGDRTIASSATQHVQGKFNIEDANETYADIVGNGTSSNRSNAYTLDWSGNGWFAGKVTVGTAPTNDLDVATKKYVDDSIPTVPDDLSDLTDVAITSATNGQVLTYNSTSSKWENANAVNTTYSISMSSNVITLTGSDGNSSTVTLPVYNGSVSSVGGGT